MPDRPMLPTLAPAEFRADQRPTASTQGDLIRVAINARMNPEAVS